MSALPLKADMAQRSCDVRFVPKADLGKGERRMKGPATRIAGEKKIWAFAEIASF